MTIDQQTFQNNIFVHKDKMFRFAKKLLNSEADAFDTVQDTMLKLWQNRAQMPDYENAEAYAMRCIKNECLSRLRHQQVIDKYKAAQKPEISTENIYGNTKDLVLRLIQQLPEKQRCVLHLRDVEEYEINEIAALMDMEEGAVRINLMRGRQKIKAQLEKIWNYEKTQIGR